MKTHIFRRLLFSLLALTTVCNATAVFTAAENEIKTTVADGINVTRWADLLIVYKDLPSTEQNEYGHNCVIDASGVCTEIIEGGDIRGKDLTIPDGGMVVSATGTKVDWLKENIKIGDYVRFDSVTMRVMVSDTDNFPITFSTSMNITGYNAVRYSNTVIIYNKSGTKTGTNGYGYEVCVSADGYIISAGGNDNTVPDGGYVISVIEQDDILLLRSHGIEGAVCKISDDKKTVTIDYDTAAVKRRAAIVLDGLKEEFEKAKSECRLIDTSEAEKQIEAVETYISENDIYTIGGQEELNGLVTKAYACMYESATVEVRGVWYEPLEKNAEGVAETVKKLKENGINQLCLGVQNSYGTIIPLPDSFPFSQKTSLSGFDLLAEYVKVCKENGIELVVCMPVFQNSKAFYKDEWITSTNNGEEGESKIFYSPANDEYFEYLLDFIEYLLTHYDIDGLQLDYIRYPYYDGNTDYGYDDITKKAFEEATGISASVVDEIAKQGSAHKNWNDWVNFKAGVVTKRVAQINELVDTLRPDIYLSACLAADYSYLPTYCQNGKEWIESGIIDAIYPMSYATGIMASQTQYFSSFDADYYLIEGSGSYMSFSKDEQLKQVLETRTYGADGISFFEMGAYFSHRYNNYLNESVFAKDAISPTYEPEKAAEECINIAIAKAEKAAEYGYISQSAAASFKEQKSIEVLKDFADTEWYKAINKYLLTAEKIEKLTKDRDFVLPEVSDTEEVSDQSNNQSQVNSTDTKGNKTNGGIILPIILGCAAVAAAAVVFILVKKKK